MEAGLWAGDYLTGVQRRGKSQKFPRSQTCAMHYAQGLPSTKSTTQRAKVASVRSHMQNTP